MTGENPDTVWGVARTRLAADLDRRTEFSCIPWRMRRTAVRRLSDLDPTVTDAA